MINLMVFHKHPGKVNFDLGEGLKRVYDTTGHKEENIWI